MSAIDVDAQVSPPSLEGIVVAEWLGAGAKCGAVIQGAPHKLAAVCRWLGFRNPCKNGRVYLTGPKMVLLGFTRPAVSW